MEIKINLQRDFGMNLLEQTGDQAAGGLVGEGMGLLFAGANRQNQLQTQQGLTNIQVAGQEQLANAQTQDQLKLWQETNYPAQMQQLEAAGLNPGLIYKQGGMGGTTGAGIPGLSAPSAGQAPSPGNSMQEGMGIAANAAQLQQADAQTKLTQSQTQLNQAQAQKISGVDTTLETTQNASLTQGISNQKAVEALTNVQTDLANIQKNIQGQTQDAQIQTIQAESQKAEQTVQQLQLQNYITAGQADTIIQQSKANLAATYLGMVWTQAQTQNTQANTAVQKNTLNVQDATIKNLNSSTAVNAQDLINMKQGVQQAWMDVFTRQDQMDIDKQKLAFQKNINDLPDSYKVPEEAVNAIFDILTLKNIAGPGKSIINGFRR